MQNEKRQLQTALVVEQRMTRRLSMNGAGSENRSDLDSDTVSDDAEEGRPVPGDSSDDELFVDCEPAPSSSIESIDRASLDVAVRTADGASTR